jgi:hypothetical protein
MMNESMRAKRVGKPLDVFVHDVLVQCPFKKARIDDSAEEPDCLPKHVVAIHGKDFFSSGQKVRMKPISLENKGIIGCLSLESSDILGKGKLST